MKRETLLKKDLNALYALFWKYFSLYIRTKELNCYTCGKRLGVKDSQAGHYEHEGNSKIWLLMSDERNVHKQCLQCNYFKGGARNEYALHLEQDYGHGILQELNEKKWKRYIPTEEEVVDRLLEIKRLLKEIS